MPKALHPIAGALALLTILTFWTATVLSELLGPATAVVTVKTLIPWGLILLIPALMVAGGSGFALSKGESAQSIQGAVDAKRKRMPFIAAIGLLVLVPACLVLAVKARAGAFDVTFYAVQAIELVAGAVNIALLGLNMRDGLRMTGRLRPRSA
ncbi:hypothetical protein [Roseospira visakhapatnamensis]|uniref:Transmembrane protein n=1 Tax=Roseospira visakhapatnamensis TaxID=390880 RepID=A0A7W6RDV2_9PROT|nr:hypothetical protein [Roseospira visakhapatnamensis]MBB4266517.1 hypothetical protein [Roseospira visakhapatnamensis]